MKNKLPVLLFFSFGLALLVRLLLIPNPGFEADVAFWKSWGLAVVDFGIVRGLRLTNFNYPTPFAYFLFLMVKTYSFFADPHNFYEFWKNNNILFLFISKLPAVLADFGIAGILFWFGKKNQTARLGLLFALVYLFNPVAIIDGAWWGQLDSLGIVVFLSAFLLILKRRPFLAGVIYMTAMMTKLQNMIYGPLFFLFLWEYLGFTALVKAVGGAVLTFLGLNIEYILARDMARVAESIVGNYNYFPWLSLNAFNPWWIVSGARGMQFSDKILSVGLVNAKTVGLFLFSGAYLCAVLRLLRKNSKKADKTLVKLFLESLMIANGAFFLFQTESHDRYAYTIIVFALLWAALWVTNTQKLKRFLIPYSVFSLLYFYNLHTALVFNYPKNGIPGLNTLTQPALTLATSYVLTGFYLWFLLFLGKDTSAWAYILPIVFIAGAIAAKNLPLITHKPVYLTAIAPITDKQDYANRQINMPTNAAFGFNKWSTLSVQYSFYRHGIGTHANSYELYDIGGHFRTFSFDYGVDTQAGPRGTVTFEVWGDDKRLFASSKIGRYDLPRHADLNITGVKNLILKVTDAGDGITDDHADWLNPKLYE